MAVDLLHKQDVSGSPVDLFRSFTVAHPRLVEAKETLMNAIHSAEPNSLIFVFGPTGVGKTTLRMKTEQLIDMELLGELHQQNEIFLGVEGGDDPAEKISKPHKHDTILVDDLKTAKSPND